MNTLFDTHTTAIAADKLEAYRATHFKVMASPVFTQQVDQYCTALAALYQATGARSAAFLTAYNPCGQATPDADNQLAQAALRADLAGRHCTLMEGIGEDPTGAWPGEPSLFALGCSQELASAHGRRYRQDAVIWAGADAVPRLLLLR